MPQCKYYTCNFLFVLYKINHLPVRTTGRLLPVPTLLTAKHEYSPDIDSLAKAIVIDGLSIELPTTPMVSDVMIVVALLMNLFQ